MLQQIKPDLSKIPGGWEPQTGMQFDGNRFRRWRKIKDGAYEMEDVLSHNDCQKLIDLFEASHIEAPVGVQGRTGAMATSEVGSKRATAWSEYLAEKFWELMKPLMPMQWKACNYLTSTDWWQGNKLRHTWMPMGISPLLRFMRYAKGGQHFAHYDAGFIYPDDNYRTLMSIVVYLTDAKPEDGGATRFILDTQHDLPIWDRNHEDWVRPVREEEVIEAVHPKQGNILIFDHRLCHDVQTYTGDTPRIIIRGDIIFEALKQ